MSENKLWKYRILRNIPGPIGAKYARKYMAKGAERMFRDAARDTTGMISIDLGANVGDYTRLLAKTARRVVSFEPDPWTVERLKENTQNLDNVEIVQAAAGAEDGEVMLYRHSDFESDPEFGSLSSSVVASKSNISTENAHAVPQINILTYLRDLNEDIGVLKIDIEGAEVDLLEGLFADKALLSRVHYIFAETHEKKIPGHEPRVEKLREQALAMSKPVVNLYWH